MYDARQARDEAGHGAVAEAQQLGEGDPSILVLAREEGLLCVAQVLETRIVVLVRVTAGMATKGRTRLAPMVVVGWKRQIDSVSCYYAILDCTGPKA